MTGRMVRHLLTSTRGTAAVEFAIVSLVFISLCVAILDFGRTFYISNHLSHLADQAVRRVLLDPGISDSSLESDVRNGFAAGDANELTVTITTETSGGSDYRVVTIGYPMTLFIPHLTSDMVALGITRRVPVN